MINLVFSPEGAWFREEGTVLLANEFRMESPVYQTILTAVARGANEWSAISGTTGKVDVTAYLSRLENIFKLIEKRAPLNGRLAGKGVRYYLSARSSNSGIALSTRWTRGHSPPALNGRGCRSTAGKTGRPIQDERSRTGSSPDTAATASGIRSDRGGTDEEKTRSTSSPFLMPAKKSSLPR